MRQMIRHIVGRTYRPMLEKYLSRTRTYRYAGLRLVIPPEVFHPGFFTSTHLLWRSVRSLDLQGKKLLELGAGSGMISLLASRQGAVVTASELNSTALRYLLMNAAANKTKLEIIPSDLFDQLLGRKFDIIAVNPPFYKKDPATEKEMAWYCGENGAYFQRFFRDLKDHSTEDGIVLMALCDSCDLDMIASLASKYNWSIKRIKTKNTVIESSFIYQIKPCADRQS